MTMLLAACSTPPPPPLAPATPTPTPPPQVVEGSPAKALADGRVEYHLVVRSDSGTIFLPIEVLVEGTAGTGGAKWVRPSQELFAYDAAGDAWQPKSGAPVDEYFDAVFPASPQELKVPVAYPGLPPGSERFRLRYRALAIPDLATHAYVPPSIGDAQSPAVRAEHRALGERVRSVEVFRWLASGFFLRDPGPVYETVATLPGPKS